MSKELTSEHKACEAHFQQNTYCDKSGRYVVSLPIKADKLSKLGQSREIAKRRFLSNERRLQRQPEIHKQYVNFMREYIELQHMRLVNEDELNNNTVCYYLPHHPVFKETSTTTKLRVVF